MQSIVRFTPSEPISFREAFDRIVIPLQNFLTFAMGQPAHLVGLTFELDAVPGEVNPMASFVEEAFRGLHEPGTSDLSWWQMPLPLMAIKDRIEDVLDRWSVLMMKAGSALDLLSSLSLGPPLYRETRFLFAIQAAEVYHRRNFSNHVLDKEDHKARIETVREALAGHPELSEWMNGLLSYSNEPTLSARLDELIDYVEPWFADFLRGDFVKVARNTRNWLTHYDSRNEKKAATGSDLFVLAQETTALLEACVLRDLGFDEQQRMDRLKDTPRFSVLRNAPRGPTPTGG
jgi:hypothetical protein